MTERLADVATAVSIGRRERQEDAVVADFVDGAETGFAVLSDGMGGHDDGDLASRIIVSEVFGALSLSGRSDAPTERDITARLRHAVLSANQCLRDQVGAGSGQEGMGGTVVTTFLKDGALRWISIGDSPLYVFRAGRLRRLNEVHSLAPQIDMMVTQGVLDAETARTHPQRDCLTSALVGSAINRIDCPDDAFVLERGDIVLMSSDGLQVLGDPMIERILRRHGKRSSQEIATALMQAVAFQEEPEQDNVSLVVIKPAIAPSVRKRRAFGVPVPQAIAAVLPRLDTLRRAFLAPLTRRSAP